MAKRLQPSSLPALRAWMTRHQRQMAKLAQRLRDMAGEASWIQRQMAKLAKAMKKVQDNIDTVLAADDPLWEMRFTLPDAPDAATDGRDGDA